MKKFLPTVLLLISSITYGTTTPWPYADSLSMYENPVILKSSAESVLRRNFDMGNFTSGMVESDPILILGSNLPDSTEQKRSHAHALLETILQAQRFVETLDALTEIEMPVGVAKSGGLLDYTILIDHIEFTTRAAIMDVYVSIALPQTPDRLAFHGKIPLSAEGGIAGSAKVYLLGDHPVRISEKTLFTIKGSQNSYVEFDCAGFAGVSIEAEVEFSRELIIPENVNGNQLPSPQRVKTSFIAHAQSLNDLMIGVNIPPFQVAGLNGIGFSVSQAFVDMSDLSNPPGFMFPAGYTSSFMQGGQPKLWQGFFLQRLEVRLPPAFKKGRNDESRVSIGVERMLLDDQGFSGNIFAERVLDQGDMSGWSYSLDRISLELVTNQVRGFSLAGKLSMPMVKSKDGKPALLGYNAHQGADGKYVFAVTIQDELKLGLWAADVKLFNGSSVVVREKQNKFYPSANLTGELTVKIGDKTSLNSIRFERMIISSEAPHFIPGTFSFGREGQSSEVSKYPLVINNISVKSQGDRVGLGFDATVNIGGKPEEEGFGGTASLVVWGKRTQKNITDSEGRVIGTDQNNWEFDKLDIGGIIINISKKNVYEFSGTVNFFEKDPIYGDGFKGSLTGKLQTIAVTANALFGRTPGFRYWYADALVSLKNGVPIVPGVLSAFGFGGGFYSKMKQSAQTAGSPLGVTPSGITYVPDENTFGIRAIVIIGTPRPEAMNGDVSLEVLLNRHGGINSVTFSGNANFMNAASIAGDKIKDLASSAAAGKLESKLASLAKGQVYGSIRLHFDNVNDVFHGNLEVYVNVAGGLVRGVSEGNKAGWAVVHFEKSDWYVLIGTPDQPIGLEVARLFKSRSYFMLGRNLPGSPPPPQQVSEILGGIDLDYMRDLNALQSGTGFAFGLHFGVDTGDLNFLIFYARFSAGTGIDFMLKDYGKNCVCEGSSDPIGIGGWYANGQAYAFVQGAIGIDVNLKFIKGRYEILAIGAAAVLQAKGPNPFWMQGTVGGYYRILGGLVKGNCSFQMTIGKECKIVPNPNAATSNPLADVEIISEVSPARDSKDVDVFTAPQAAFNIPMKEVFEINEGESRRFFRGRVESFNVLDGSNVLSGDLRWNEANDVVAFETFDVLPPHKTLRAIIKVVFEELKDGKWSVVYFDGKPSEEIKETSFITGEAPDYIPSSNVDISYPAVGQFNFYPKEYNEGFIILKKGQGYLFKTEVDWIQKLRITDVASNAHMETDIGYIESEKRTYFSIPGGLSNGKAYRIEIANFPKQSRAVDANIRNVEKSVTGDGVGNEMTVTTKRIEGNIDLAEIKIVYSSVFRTSSYNTFKEKIIGVGLSNTAMIPIETNIFQLTSYISGKELFDNAEINGKLSDRLIQFEAILDQNDWFRNLVNPLVYQGFPLFPSMKIRLRDINEFGFPPVKSVFIKQPGYSPVLTEENLGAVTFSPASVYNSVIYDLMAPAYTDYLDIQNQVANYVVDNSSRAVSVRFSTLLATRFPVYTYGKYRMKVNYVIPRVDKTTSTHEWELSISGGRVK